MKTLVTLDLHNLPDDAEGKKKRRVFNQVLRAEGWVELEDATTAWALSWSQFSPEAADDVIRAHLTKAARKARIRLNDVSAYWAHGDKIRAMR